MIPDEAINITDGIPSEIYVAIGRGRYEGATDDYELARDVAEVVRAECKAEIDRLKTLVRDTRRQLWRSEVDGNPFTHDDEIPAVWNELTEKQIQACSLTAPKAAGDGTHDETRRSEFCTRAVEREKIATLIAEHDAEQQAEIDRLKTLVRDTRRQHRPPRNGVHFEDQLPESIVLAIREWANVLETGKRRVVDCWPWMLAQIDAEGQKIVDDVSRARRYRDRHPNGPIRDMPASWFMGKKKPGPPKKH
jgi:hypothetical protein